MKLFEGDMAGLQKDISSLQRWVWRAHHARTPGEENIYISPYYPYSSMENHPGIDDDSIARPSMVIMCTMGTLRHHGCGSRAVAHSLRFAFGCGEVSRLLRFFHPQTLCVMKYVALNVLQLCGRSCLTK